MLINAYLAAYGRIYNSDPPPTPASGRGFGRREAAPRVAEPKLELYCNVYLCEDKKKIPFHTTRYGKNIQLLIKVMGINTYFHSADNLFAQLGDTPSPFFRYLCVKLIV